MRSLNLLRAEFCNANIRIAGATLKQSSGTLPTEKPASKMKKPARFSFGTSCRPTKAYASVSALPGGNGNWWSSSENNANNAWNRNMNYGNSNVNRNDNNNKSNLFSARCLKDCFLFCLFAIFLATVAYAQQGSTITNCYAIGNVSGQSNVGGISGSDNAVETSYFAGSVTGTGSDVGGIVGSGTVTNSYYNSDLATASNLNGFGFQRTTAEMKNQGTYAGWGFTDIWGILASVNDGYPNFRKNYEGAVILPPTLASKTSNSITINAALAPVNGQIIEYAISKSNIAPASGWQTELTFGELTPNTIYYIFARSRENINYYVGTPSLALQVAVTFQQNNWSSEADPSWYLFAQTEFVITTAEQLAGLAYIVNEGHGNFSGKKIILGNNISLNNTENWENWATATYAEIKLWTPIGTTTNPFRGTFEGNGFVISGVYIDNTSDNQGLFGVTNGGKIEKVGVVASYINGGSNIGGLVGNGNTAIEYCYSTANVSGASNIGGLIGNRGSGSITHSYATGNITGTSNVGGLTGNGSGTITNCYYNSETLGGGSNGFGRFTMQMKTQSNYIGWDFITPVWKIDNSGITNDGYPYLYIHIPTYTVTFDSDGGSYVERQIIQENGLITEPANPIREGFTFLGWIKDAEGKFWNFLSDAVIGDMTLTAVWEAIPPETPVLPRQIANAQIGMQAIGGNIMLQNLPANVNVEIYNLKGSRVYSANSGNSQILRILVQTKGLYIIKIQTGSEKQVLLAVVR